MTLDSDLAELYGVSTKRFNEQIKRNQERFPEDFMFQLTSEEAENLRTTLPALRFHRTRGHYGCERPP